MTTINIREIRANKEQDALLWKPRDCVEAVLRDLDSGELGQVDAVYIAMVRKGETGQAQSFPFYTAGCTTLELRGMLTQHLHDMCDAFTKSRVK